MKKLLFFILLLTSLNAFSNNNTKKESDLKTETIITQNNEIINGVVVDSKTNEILSGVLIMFDNNKIYTDLNGEFKIDESKIQKIKSIYLISYQNYNIVRTKNKIIIQLKQI